MKLFYGPGACSLGIHLLLEEIGKPYDTQKLDTRSGETQSPPFTDINPKGKVPALQRDDGAILTEYPAIAYFLAKTNPDAHLFPNTLDAELQAHAAVDYCTATIHMQGATRFFRPGNFAPTESDHDKVKARGKEIVTKGFAELDKDLNGKHWIAGDYSYADSALFYVSYWGVKRLGLDLPPTLAGHYQRMLERPATKRMMEQEGLQS